MSWFQILILIGFCIVIVYLWMIANELNKIAQHLSHMENIERYLFGIRYHIPSVEYGDEIRKRAMEIQGEDGSFPDLETMNDIKNLLQSIDEKLKKTITVEVQRHGYLDE
jgi:hypothetical protein